MTDSALTVLQPGTGEIFLRLLTAVLIGAVVGMEREFANRPAGLRTHTLVAIASCSIMIMSELLFAQYKPLGANPDPARLGAQVIAGVGFLGAGTIMREGANVKGLTTAASIWTVACLGLAAGAGYYRLALIAGGIVLLVLTVFEWGRDRLLKLVGSSVRYTVFCVNAGSVIDELNRSASQNEVKLKDMRLSEEEGNFEICFSVNYSGKHAKVRLEDFNRLLECSESIVQATANGRQLKG